MPTQTTSLYDEARAWAARGASVWYATSSDQDQQLWRIGVEMSDHDYGRMLHQLGEALRTRQQYTAPGRRAVPSRRTVAALLENLGSQDEHIQQLAADLAHKGRPYDIIVVGS